VLGLLGRDKGGLPILEVKLFVGQDDHLVKLKELLGVHALDGAESIVVGIVGVKGMGGIGKSTIAKKLYDDPEVREHFAGKICWLEVGPEPSKDKIRDLQKQILKRFCDSDEDPGNPSNGRALIRQRLSGKKVLICLVDVWESASIASAVVNVDDLAPGSRILKTSRIRGAIEATGAVHEMDVLGPGVAWELFCWHAFGGKDPDSSIAEKAKQAADVCAGLPLALELVGKQVRGAAEKEECLSAFLKLHHEEDAMINTRTIIKSSLDMLPDQPSGLHETFVLIAGIWPSTPEFREHGRALENIGAAVYGGNQGSSMVLAAEREGKATRALEKLRDLSLVGMSEGELTVHDLIVDVAEDMKQKFPRHFKLSSGGHSVDWHSVASVVFENGGGLVTPSRVVDSPCRLLSIHQVQPVSFRRLRDLECLRLHELEVWPRPGWLSFIELPLRRRLLMWRFLKGIMQLKALRLIEIRDCPALRSLPAGIGQLTGLRRLHLRGCEALRSLPEQIGQLTGLTTLDLSECGALESLPEQIGQLTGLTTLYLRGCEALESLLEGIGHLTRLTTLDLRWCRALRSLPEGIGQLTGLTRLHLRGCEALRSLSEQIGQLTGLTTLNLSECGALESLPEQIGQLTGLTTLDLSLCRALRSLPEEIGQLTGLTTLYLIACEALQSLPEQIGQLTGLTSLYLIGCGALQSLPAGMGQLTGLMTLDLSRCDVCIPAVVLSMLQSQGVEVKRELGVLR
jgi:Leucine-rich repeat (LRR) protein